ncbi:MAG: enoyl-CoA hydratase/isomerase family protein [Armatimonadetes bacterium]|nr:enoyl-CoA hydratase/isomerase family protein [Armatimonadota bacterium]MDE2206517.1 enoyl-CoA hydratase/isomerase family protein [Armatimonadota bacterium]
MMNQHTGSGRAVVVGGGVMGSQIAAHLVNVGWQADVLDVVSTDGTDRSSMASAGILRAAKLRPDPFFAPSDKSRIRAGNTTDNLDWMAGADWVIEAVVESAEIKRSVLAAIEGAAGPTAIITTNTSGLSISDMSAGRSDSFRERFFGTHFFNPPRYMRLMEIIPTPETSPAVLEQFTGFSEDVLGKRVAYAHDTPGFIANRLGVFAMMRTVHAALKYDLNVETVDALTGPLIGRPKSGTFRLCDICGLDITADVAANLSSRLVRDRYHSSLDLPEPMATLLEQGRIGEKVGAGFYKRLPDRQILALDWATLNYRPRHDARLSRFADVRALPLAERLRKLLADTSPEAMFLWEVLRDLLCCASDISAEIADTLPAIDNACRWGFGWELGPFETLDALGLRWFAERVAEDGLAVPACVEQALQTGADSFYTAMDGARLCVDVTGAPPRSEIVEAPKFLSLARVRGSGGVIRETPDLSLLDTGDGILCLEFHSKMNVLGDGISAFIDASREEAERNGAALIIANQGEHFSAGFNLQLVLMGIYERDWDSMLNLGQRLQLALLRLKRARVPVVAGVHGYALGGGCEVMLHAARVVAAAESYIGLPEAGVGVIPAAGGTTELVVRALAGMPPAAGVDAFPYVHRAFEAMGMAQISSSARGAVSLGYLRPDDIQVANSDAVVATTRAIALEMASQPWHAAEPAAISAMGSDGIARFDLELHIMRRSGYISEHDALIGHELASVMCGGNLPHPSTVTEEYMLQLEAEAFVRLCSTVKTAERIKTMLETGRPVRN